jgi:hypothetical protein
MINQTFEDRVFKMLFDLETNVRFVLAKNVRAENMDRFMSAVKLFIRYDAGKDNGFYIEFSNDYKYLYKVSNKGFIKYKS